MRSVRSLYYRASPDARECDLLRAMHSEVVRTMERVRQQALRERDAVLSGDGLGSDVGTPDATSSSASLAGEAAPPDATPGDGPSRADA